MRVPSIALSILAAAAAAPALAQVDPQAEHVAAGALRVFGDPIRAHGNWAVDVDLDAKAARCVSAGWDTVARVWSLAEGRRETVLIGHEDVVYFARFCGGGAQVVTAAADRTLRLWNAVTGEQVARVECEGARQVGEVSPDGTKILVADPTADVAEIRALPSLEVEAEIPFADAILTDLAWSPDGKFAVLAGSLDARVDVWDIAGKTLRASCTPPAALSVRLNADGSRLAVGGYDSLTVWSFPDLGDEPTHSVSGFDSNAKGVTWRDEEHLVFGDAEGVIQCVRLEDPALLWGIYEHRDAVQHMASAAGVLASASRDTNIRLWSLEDGRELHTGRGNRDMIEALAWSADSGRVVAGDYGNVTAVVDLARGEIVRREMAHASWILATGSEGSTLWSLGGDGVVVGFVDDQPSRRIELPAGDAVAMCGWFRGNAVATGWSDGALRVYDLQSGERTVELAAAHEAEVVSIAGAVDGRLATAGADGKVVFWSADGEKQGAIEGLESFPTLAFCGDAVVGALDDGTCQVWEFGTGTRLHTLAFDEEDPVRCVAGWGDKLLTGHFDSIRVQDPKTGDVVRTIEGFASIPTSLSPSPDGKWLASGMLDGTVLVWKVEAF